MMYASNLVAIVLTLFALLGSGELWTSIDFLFANPDAVYDNATIAVTSATGQLFIFYTIKSFGPVVFTIIMTTRQMLSMMLSAVMFGHAMAVAGYVGSIMAFATVFARVRREVVNKRAKAINASTTELESQISNMQDNEKLGAAVIGHVNNGLDSGKPRSRTSSLDITHK